jgi:hypothetical protein
MRSSAVVALMRRELEGQLVVLIERAVLYPGPVAEGRVRAVKRELAELGA